MLSILGVLGTKSVVGPEAWEAWAWRLPFILSLLLLVVSLYMRLKLRESPVFKAMKEAGETSANPLKESFRSEEHTSELQSLMRISYAVFCLKKKTIKMTQEKKTQI